LQVEGVPLHHDGGYMQPVRQLDHIYEFISSQDHTAASSPQPDPVLLSSPLPPPEHAYDFASGSIAEEGGAEEGSVVSTPMEAAVHAFFDQRRDEM